MAKISCSYLLILMLALSVLSVVEKAKGDKRCSIIIDLSPCYPIECRLSCIAERNGDGECVVSKVGSTPNCLCTYDC
ncbi:Defensin-like protein 155 [Arabidopsis thaliana]